MNLPTFELISSGVVASSYRIEIGLDYFGFAVTPGAVVTMRHGDEIMGTFRITRIEDGTAYGEAVTPAWDQLGA